MIAVGQKAPDFHFAEPGQERRQAVGLRRKKSVVLHVVSTLDWSPTCTNEHACFVNEMKSARDRWTLKFLASAWTACGRTRPMPTRWGSNIRCSPIFVRGRRR